MECSRNAPCPCGSGKKFKRCCGAGDTACHSGKSPSAPLILPRLAACSFSCAIECAELCCGGATLVTIDEIRRVYDVFPLTIGFRKYRPASPRHRTLLETIGTRLGEDYVVGDFIAGNRFASRCSVLGADHLCGLHSKGVKPLQCVIVPFCAVYPEDMQDIVFQEQRRSAFAQCRGYRELEDSDSAVWAKPGFINEATRSAFLSFQRGLRRQKPYMEKIFRGLAGQNALAAFLKGDGMIEAVPTPAILFEILAGAGFSNEEMPGFVMSQKRLCDIALSGHDPENPVLRDYLTVLKGIRQSPPE